MGTIWLDARGFELRFIEFRYTRLPQMPYAERVGGEVHFARLASGAWIVDRWFIRMPQVIVTPQSAVPRRQLFEEGGAVITEGVAPSARPAAVTGVVRDSAGRPVPGAVVRAIGTHRQVLTGDNGAFTLDSLPPGGLSVVAHTDGYDSFAVLAAARRIDLQAGRVQRVDLRAPDSRGIRREVMSRSQPSVHPAGTRVAARCACSWWTARRRSRCRASASLFRGRRRQTLERARRARNGTHRRSPTHVAQRPSATCPTASPSRYRCRDRRVAGRMS